MKKGTQRQWVIDQLRAHGKISRNECLRNYISRLSAIIQNLEAEGMVFDTKTEGGDYVYYLAHDNKKRVEYHIPGLNKTIIKYE